MLTISLLIFILISSSIVNNNKDVLAIATTTVSMVSGSQLVDNQEFYDPAQVTVNPGDSIKWKNDDAALHTATSGNHDTATPDGKFDTGLVGANQESKPVAMPAEPGEYTYFCTLHPWMGGTVMVYSSSEDAEDETVQTSTTPVPSTGTTAAAKLAIPQGASVQGNPSYEPDPLAVKVGYTIDVDNKDTTPHTVTNGKDATDPNMGKLFDTSIINAGDSAEIVTADLKPGEYPYFCAVHPYMKGTLSVQSTTSSTENSEEQNPLEETTTDEKTPTTSANRQRNQIDIILTNRSDLLTPLLDDATEYLQNGDNEGALVYMSFVRQQLLLQDSNSSTSRLTGLLVDDAIKDLQNKSSDVALLHLNLAKEQMTNSLNMSDIMGIETVGNMIMGTNQSNTQNPSKEIPIIGQLLGEERYNQSQPYQGLNTTDNPLSKIPIIGDLLTQ